MSSTTISTATIGVGVSVALYYFADVTSAGFSIAATLWILAKLPSFPILIIASISFLASYITLLPLPHSTHSVLATIAYYALCGYLASEIAKTSRENE